MATIGNPTIQIRADEVGIPFESLVEFAADMGQAIRDALELIPEWNGLEREQAAERIEQIFDRFVSSIKEGD